MQQLSFAVSFLARVRRLLSFCLFTVMLGSVNNDTSDNSGLGSYSTPSVGASKESAVFSVAQTQVLAFSIVQMPGRFAQGRRFPWQILEITADNSEKDEHALKLSNSQVPSCNCCHYLLACFHDHAQNATTCCKLWAAIPASCSVCHGTPVLGRLMNRLHKWSNMTVFGSESIRMLRSNNSIL